MNGQQMKNKILEWQPMSGRPIPAGAFTITPQSQALTLRLPFVGLGWARPTAILVQQGAQTENVPIKDLSGRYVLLAILAALPLALILTHSLSKPPTPNSSSNYELSAKL